MSEAYNIVNFHELTRYAAGIRVMKSRSGWWTYVLFRAVTRLTSSIHAHRLAGFYLIGVFIGGFSAIFAYALTFLGGKAGISAWSWIFVSSRIDVV